jgi:hypothetical protein
MHEHIVRSGLLSAPIFTCQLLAALFLRNKQINSGAGTQPCNFLNVAPAFGALSENASLLQRFGGGVRFTLKPLSKQMLFSLKSDVWKSSSRAEQFQGRNMQKNLGSPAALSSCELFINVKRLHASKGAGVAEEKVDTPHSSRAERARKKINSPQMVCICPLSA